MQQIYILEAGKNINVRINVLLIQSLSSWEIGLNYDFSENSENSPGLLNTCAKIWV